MFIVIEGIDGAGCETQANLVFKALKSSHKKTFFKKYPYYSSPVGKMIKEFLYESKHLSAEKQFLLYSLQFIFDAETIVEELQKGVVVADRYFTTTLCFQTLEGFPEGKALQFAQDFGIIKPDFAFFLDVRPEIAIRWKEGEDKVLNFREKDFAFMERTYAQYNDLIERNVWTKWIRISGERSKKEVCAEIVEYITTHYEK